MELIALPTPERMFQATINYAKPPASGQFKIWQQHPAVSLWTQCHCSLLDFAHYFLGLSKPSLGGFALVIHHLHHFNHQANIQISFPST